jgi:hypothetical protein
MATVPATTSTTAPTSHGAAVIGPVAIGGVGGLAWAAGFRGYMAAVAGPGSAVDWLGTFEGILLPGLVTGALLGWAEHLRRTGARPGRRRWLALAPLAFVVATPGVLVSVITDGGIGGGAVAVPLIGMAGGFALSGRGPRAARVAAALLPVAAAGGWAVAATAIGPGLSVASPRGAWVAVLFAASLAVLSLACAIPYRPAGPAPVVSGAGALVAVGGVTGLAWAAGLRTLMVEFAGPGSHVSWGGTFAGILLPGLVAGAVLGRCEHRRRTGARRSWTVRGPAALGVAVTAVAVGVVLAGGLGGGALAVVVCGAGGGYALAGRGRPAARVAAGLLPVTVVIAMAVAAQLLDPGQGVTTPRGAWILVLFASSLAVACSACAIPYRRADRPERRPSLTARLPGRWRGSRRTPRGGPRGAGGSG